MSTPMYKVAFAITRPTHDPGHIQDVETYYFDDIGEAEACLTSLASMRLKDTRAYEVQQMNWELVKRRHKPSQEREAFKHAHQMRINHAYCHMRMALSQVDWCPSAEDPLQRAFTWGSAESVTANLYSATLCKHRFYLENAPSVVKKMSVAEIKSMLGRSYV